MLKFALALLLVTLCVAQEDDVARGKFVETSSQKKSCGGPEDCYDQREPKEWCQPEEGQEWTDRGCFCEETLRACVIERKNHGNIEHAYCAADYECE